ncbi:MAG: XkdF-like putative serine protease domain-containing protein [Campylobacter sputorum]|uniref:XkdF-like putative serine protease domain-containing protein n=1 Tax=Campylobacter sputorum TaxID=206 RepID=UPI002A91E0CF|nr:XkdF-like putative serine protease domain-containing protein [Campylobacter sputorum]MDY6120424.1 XkdF-like putative serine protease domain-containing protein [Campylobacter sputorum]
MAEISDMKIKLISIVKEGANQKEIIYKDSKFHECLRVDFSKSDKEQGVVYGLVYAPNEIDTQGDFANANEIKKAAYTFMKEQDMHCVDINHNFEYAPAYICESWIVKENDPFFGEVGAWAVGIKLESDELKQMVKSGDLKGLSMYGSGVLKENKPNFYEKMKNELINFFEKRDKTFKKGDEVEKENTTEVVENGGDLTNLTKSIESLKNELSTLKDELKKNKDEMEEFLSKSKQVTSVNEIEKSASKGIL